MSHGNSLAIGLSIGLGIPALTVLCLILFFLYRRRQWKQKQASSPDNGIGPPGFLGHHGWDRRLRPDTIGGPDNYAAERKLRLDRPEGSGKRKRGMRHLKEAVGNQKGRFAITKITRRTTEPLDGTPGGPSRVQTEDTLGGPQTGLESSVVLIQRTWRGYSTRKHLAEDARSGVEFAVENPPQVEEVEYEIPPHFRDATMEDVQEAITYADDQELGKAQQYSDDFLETLGVGRQRTVDFGASAMLDGELEDDEDDEDESDWASLREGRKSRDEHTRAGAEEPDIELVDEVITPTIEIPLAEQIQHLPSLNDNDLYLPDPPETGIINDNEPVQGTIAHKRAVSDFSPPPALSVARASASASASPPAEGGFVSPFAVEKGPNPVIHAHLLHTHQLGHHDIESENEKTPQPPSDDFTDFLEDMNPEPSFPVTTPPPHQLGFNGMGPILEDSPFSNPDYGQATGGAQIIYTPPTFDHEPHSYGNSDPGRTPGGSSTYTGSRHGHSSATPETDVSGFNSQSPQPPRSPLPYSASPPLACHVCGETFDKRYKLNKHVSRKHEKRYKCPEPGCEMAFGLHADLIRHGKSKHSSEAASEVFVCDNPECSQPGKEFTRRDNFLRHQRRCQARSGNSTQAA